MRWSVIQISLSTQQVPGQQGLCSKTLSEQNLILKSQKVKQGDGVAITCLGGTLSPPEQVNTHSNNTQNPVSCSQKPELTDAKATFSVFNE